MEEQITVLKKVEGVIPMPTKIKIGDPMYFEDGEGLKHTYTKSFRGKNNWASFLEVTKNKITCPPDEYCKETMDFEDMCFKLYLAYDDKMLSLLKQNKIYKTQKERITELGVDTASYILGVNDLNNPIIMRTGGDGSIGYVCEYYTKSKLDAVVIEVTMPYDSDRDFESGKEILEYLFKCKLNEVAV